MIRGSVTQHSVPLLFLVFHFGGIQLRLIILEKNIAWVYLAFIYNRSLALEL